VSWEFTAFILDIKWAGPILVNVVISEK